jgi:hypothetical protein
MTSTGNNRELQSRRNRASLYAMKLPVRKQKKYKILQQVKELPQHHLVDEAC